MSQSTESQLRQIDARLARIQQRGERIDAARRKLFTRPPTPAEADEALARECKRLGGDCFAVGPDKGPTVIFDGPSLRKFFQQYPPGDDCREQYFGRGDLFVTPPGLGEVPLRPVPWASNQPQQG